LKEIFNSVGATSEEITPSTEDIPGAFDHIENEVEALDEVITGHGDFCALVASCGTAAAFMKAECNHARVVNKPNFNLSSLDLVDVPTEVRSIGNRFITKFGQRAGVNWPGMKHESCLTQYETLPLSFYLDFSLLNFRLPYTLFFCRMMAPEVAKPKLVLKY
jgi:hypothetical protein